MTISLVSNNDKFRDTAFSFVAAGIRIFVNNPDISDAEKERRLKEIKLNIAELMLTTTEMSLFLSSEFGRGKPASGQAIALTTFVADMAYLIICIDSKTANFDWLDYFHNAALLRTDPAALYPLTGLGVLFGERGREDIDPDSPPAA